MRIPTSRPAKFAAAAATPVAVIVAAGLIWQSSYAAFSGTTRNSGNDWATGSVTLTDDDAGASRFQVGAMTPEATGTQCIKITANASVPGTVKGYAVNPVTSPAGLEDHIKIVVSSGTGGSFATCEGYVKGQDVIPASSDTSLSDLAASNSYDAGIGGWDVDSGTQSRTYSITWTFDTVGLTQTQINLLQGSHTGIDFQWELQSS
ncbi:hypothetical protein GCM10027020_23650 [Nocardioides salsibiostraticola]